MWLARTAGGAWAGNQPEAAAGPVSTTSAVAVQAIGSVAELESFVAIGELGRALLAGDPGTATLRNFTLLLLGGLALRAPLRRRVAVCSDV
jgi:hypothetical protein